MAVYFFDILLATQEFGSLDEVDQRPMVEERDHGALAAAQVQAVVPVGTQALADARLADLFGGEIQGSLEVLVDSGFSTVGKGNDLVEEGDFAGLLDVLADRGDDPECVVGTGVFQAVDDICRVRCWHHGGQLEHHVTCLPSV